MTNDQLKAAYDVLTGKWKHYCYEWDELPIDETCPEFACCTCEFDEDYPQEGLAEAREAAGRIMDEMFGEDVWRRQMICDDCRTTVDEVCSECDMCFDCCECEEDEGLYEDEPYPDEEH